MILNIFTPRIERSLFFKIHLILCLFFAAESVKAQQEPMYSQYMFNMVQVNPAYAGNWAVDNVTLLSRRQWANVHGAPSTFALSWDSRRDDSPVGYGVQVYNDKLGIEKTTGIQGFYSYRLSFPKSYLSFGISAGVLNYRAAFSEVETYTPKGEDPLFREDVSNFLPTVGLGLIFATEKWYASLSIPALLKTKVTTNNSLVTTNASNHYFLTAGYIMTLSDNIKIKPSTMIKAVSGADIQYDLNMNAWINDMVGVGLSYRTKDAIVAMCEIQLASQFRLGYAFDYTLTRMGDYSKGTHELMLRYEFSRNKKQKVLSPRYF